MTIEKAKLATALTDFVDAHPLADLNRQRMIRALLPDA